MIYADNAATTRLDTDAFEAMRPFLLEEYANVSQPYLFSRNAKKALRADEIYFTSGGTESDNWAIKGLMRAGDTQLIITSQIEHHAVLNACLSVERMGIPVRRLPVSREGIIEAELLQASISDQTKLVSVMLANNEIGTVEPVPALAEIAHKRGVLFHTDAVQASQLL